MKEGKTFPPTEQQQKVLDAVRYIEQRRSVIHELETLFVVASAGTGKTTTLLEAIMSLMKPANGRKRPHISHVAFNRATMVDAQRKCFAAGVDRYVDTRTINSWGCAFLSRTKYSHLPTLAGGRKFDARNNIKQSWQELAAFLRIRIATGSNITHSVAERMAAHISYHAWKTVENFCYSKSDKIERKHIAWPRKNGPESKKHLIGITAKEWVGYANALWSASINLQNERVSFCQTTMMKEVHLHLKANPDLVPTFMLQGYANTYQDYTCVNPTVDYYMVDESQDMDECCFDIIEMAACRGKSVLIWIGDSRQSIYQFKGAKDCLTRAVEKVPEIEREKRVFYLTLSHRFGPIIAAAVGGFVTGVMEPRERADYEFRKRKSGCSGDIALPPPLIGVSSFEGIIHDSKSPCLAYPYAVLCRTNKGVVLGALRAVGLMHVYNGSGSSETQTQIREGVKLFWLGEKNSLNSLVTILENLIKLADKGVPYLYKRVKIYNFDKLMQIAEEEEDPDMTFYCKFVEKLLTVEGLDISGFIQTLRNSEVEEERFADVILGTIHQAKGREFDRVQMGDDFAEFIKPREQDKGLQDGGAVPFVTASSLTQNVSVCDHTECEEVQLVVKRMLPAERNCIFVLMTRAKKE